MKRIALLLSTLVVALVLFGCARTRNQAPVLKGVRTEVTINKGEAYNPLDGVEVEDEDDGLEEKIEIIGNYDVNQVGVHKFRLKVTDSQGESDEVEITLTVIDPTSDNKPPVLEGVRDVVHYIGSPEPNLLSGVSALDPEDGVISSENITVEGEYDFDVEGVYVLTVKAVDSDGASVTQVMVLSVIKHTVPDELSNEEIVVTFWHAFGKDKEAVIRKYADDFEAQYPNIKIELTSQGGYEDLRSKVSSAIISKTEPVMLIGYPDHVAGYLAANAVEPLDPYVSHPKWGTNLDDFVEAYVTENRSFDDSGTLYGLPFNKSTEVLIYNKTFFDANDLEAPETWDDVVEIAKVVKQKHPEEDVYGFAYDSAANMFITLTRQWGGQYTDIDSNGDGVMLFDNPQTKAMLQYFVNLEKDNYATLPQAWEQDYASDPFINQKVFMTVGSIAGITYNVPSDGAFELGIVPIPQRSNDTKAVIQQGTNISIMRSATDQQKLAAWLFTRHLTSTEVTTDWAINSGYLPVRESAFQSERYQNFLNYDGDDLTQKYISMAANAAYEQRDYMFVDQPFIGSSRARTEVDHLITTVIVGDVEIDVAIRRALAELE